MATAKLPTTELYMSIRGIEAAMQPPSTYFIGRSRSVSGTSAENELRAARLAAHTARTPASSEPRSETSVHTPPTSIAPTPRKRSCLLQSVSAASAADSPARLAASAALPLRKWLEKIGNAVFPQMVSAAHTTTTAAQP